MLRAMSASSEARRWLMEVLGRSGAPASIWQTDVRTPILAQQQLAWLQGVRRADPGLFAELRDIVTQRDEVAALRSGAVGSDIGEAVAGDHQQLLLAQDHVAGDHVDFGGSTFHDEVVGVQHIHYGAAPAQVEWRPVRDVEPWEFGVPRDRHAGSLPEVLPYVRRDRDEELASQLRHPGLVLILGKAYSGKSHTAWNGVRSLEDHQIHAPNPDEDWRALVAGLRGEPGHHVVWLDELTDHLRVGGLDLRMLGLLTDLGIVVLGTMTPDEYYRRRAGTTAGDRVVARARTVELARQWSSAELERLRVLDDPRAHPAYMWSGREGAAAYFAIGHLMFDEWRRAGTQQEHPGGRLLVQAAVDVARCGVAGPVPAELLERVYDNYADGSEETFESALAWAATPLFGVSGLLVRGDTPGTWRAYGALVGEALRSEDLLPVPEGVWWTLLGAAEHDLSLDHKAVHRAAQAALRSRIVAGDTAVMLRLAMFAESDEKEAWFRRAAERGDQKAITWLVELLLERGEERAALPYLEVAAEVDVRAGARLGHILQDMALSRLTRAAERGDAAAAHSLGQLLAAWAGRETEALSWCLRAYAWGDASAAATVGRLLWSQHDASGAESWFEAARDAGDPEGTYRYALLLVDRDVESAALGESLLRDLASSGHTRASTAYGYQKERQGQTAEAREWYRRGYDGGDVEAAYRMGMSLKGAGQPDEAARAWLRQAADRGHLYATWALSDLREPNPDTVME
ncbi:hypothetical protein ABZT17_03395 [Streptomyces sp. NPDC005648]|uniref:tetratricopeptide repeat protein n=1 Tax=Streptomyces sp. NPDC005648 TaxID=3157044 RepID=UPI0033A26F17